jgi:hypothetical protein
MEVGKGKNGEGSPGPEFVASRSDPGRRERGVPVGATGMTLPAWEFAALDFMFSAKRLLQKRVG